MTTFKNIACALTLVVAATAASSASAETTFRPGGYQNFGNYGRYNATTGAFHIPGQSVYKSTGRYDHIGNGYYRNPYSGNIYNPGTRSYTSGKNLTFRPGNYQLLGNTGMRFNGQTGALHLPGQAVIKPTGVYHHMGNGYYKNPVTGNTYNPYTRAYKYR